jgi:hypothetical protein
MSILLPEKIIIAILASGLSTVKAENLIPKIFDANVLGAPFIAMATEYISSNPIKIRQGYGVDDTQLPGWYVVPANITPSDDFVGDYVAEEETVQGDLDGDVYEANYNSFSLRVISATNNADATMIVEAIARYILLSGREILGENYGLHEASITATDLDPIYQYLPEHLYYRSTVLNFRGMNYWERNYIIIRDAELFIKFNPNEDFIEV